MKKLLITILLLLFTGLGTGAEQPPNRSPEKSPEPVSKKAPAKSVRAEQPPAPWPRPYKPSEEISADSAVPFPTDI